MKAKSHNRIKSVIPGIKWPAMPDRMASQMLGCLQQLNHSQWMTPVELHTLQQENVRKLLKHAIDTVPFYKEIYTQVGVNEDSEWAQIPIVQRMEIQAAGEAMYSQAVPKSHGTVGKIQTSGTSGVPLQLQSTAVTRFMWMVFTLREHLWHTRDFSLKLVVIRPDENDVHKETEQHNSWGPPASLVYDTGPSAYSDTMKAVNKLLHWLYSQKPDYFLTQPTVLRELLNESQRVGMKPKKLLQVRTLGEVVTEDLRNLCFQLWQVPIVDMYSSRELGYIALQCPDTNVYHLQSEGLFCEILNDQGMTCQPGEVGRLVVTSLYNYTSPMLRYETMDYVEVAEPCSCGRGLQAIRRILGRKRNFLRHPDGRRYLPAFKTHKWIRLAPIRQIQFVQKSLTHLEVRILPQRNFSESEEQSLRNVFREVFDVPFEITFKYFNETLRHVNGKFEDFVCEITDQ